MRGSPLLRALVAFLLLLALGVPLWRLTHTSAAVPAAPRAEVKGETKSARLRLTFSAPPATMRVLHLGEEVWRETAPGAEIERELRVPFPQEGIELQFEVAWPEETLGAMRARLTTPDGTEMDRSVWGKGAVTEVVSFP